MPRYIDQSVQPGEVVEYRGRVSRAAVAKGRNAPLRTLMVDISMAALALMLAGCGGGNTKVSAAKFCTDSSATFSAIQSLTSNNLAPPGKSDLTSAAAQVQKLVNEAPAQIKADLTTERSFLEKASTNGIDAVDSATTDAENAAVGRLNTWAAQNCVSGNVSASTSPQTSVTTASLTAFCADVSAVAGDAAVVHTTLQSGISASVFQQYVTAAQHLADEAPPTPSNLAPDATAVASDLSALLRSPNDPNAAPNFVPDTAALSTDGSTDCSGGVAPS